MTSPTRIAPIAPIELGDRAVAPTKPTGDGKAAAAFSDRLQDAMEALESTAQAADNTSEGLVTGEVDVHEAMISMEKADLMLRVAGTVRNKVIDAYQQLVQAAGG